MTDNLKEHQRGKSTGVFWTWATAAYERSGVADSLLAAQDRAGLNVNIALWACWTATHFEEAPDSAMRSAIDIVEAWNAGVTKNLRAARRAAKPFEDNPAYPGAGKLRTAIKAAELDAERIEIERLESLALRVLRPAAKGDVIARAEKNLALYGALAGAAAHDNASPALLQEIINHIFGAPRQSTPSAKERDPS